MPGSGENRRQNAERRTVVHSSKKGGPRVTGDSSTEAADRRTYEPERIVREVQLGLESKVAGPVLVLAVAARDAPRCDQSRLSQ